MSYRPKEVERGDDIVRFMVLDVSKPVYSEGIKVHVTK